MPCPAKFALYKDVQHTNSEGLVVRFDMEINEKSDGRQYVFTFIRPETEASLSSIRGDIAQHLHSMKGIDLDKMTYVEVTDKEWSGPAQAMKFKEFESLNGTKYIDYNSEARSVNNQEVEHWRARDPEPSLAQNPGRELRSLEMKTDETAADLKVESLYVPKTPWDVSQNGDHSDKKHDVDIEP